MEKTFKADVDELSNVMGWVEHELEDTDCSGKMRMQISVCVEEIFINIAQYAYESPGGEVSLELLNESGILLLRFSDSGRPFDPLSNQEPDIKMQAEERPIGGLGIHIVKKMMDEVNYSFENGKNILTMKKLIK